LATIFTSAFGNFVVLSILIKIGVHYLLAGVCGIAVAALINFFLNDKWVFKE